MKSKIITIEGTDCSGKETQSKLLEKTLKMYGYTVNRFSFPQYDEPTGKIVGGPYLGKPEISECLFEEGAVNVDPLVASLYYAADRRYSFLKFIEKEIDNNDVLILDRYIPSNLGHQGSKISDEFLQDEFFDKLYKLEHEICELPESDAVIFLHMPTIAASILKKNRTNLDQHELSVEHLTRAEQTYLRLCRKYGWKYINCLKEEFVDFNSIKTPNVIADEVYDCVMETLNTEGYPRLKMTRYN